MLECFLSNRLVLCKSRIYLSLVHVLYELVFFLSGDVTVWRTTCLIMYKAGTLRVVGSSGMLVASSAVDRDLPFSVEQSIICLNCVNVLWASDKSLELSQVLLALCLPAVALVYLQPSPDLPTKPLYIVYTVCADSRDVKLCQSVINTFKSA